MRKKLLVNCGIIIMVFSVILTGFPLNLLVQNVSGVKVLAEENNLTLESLPNDTVIPEVDEVRIENLEENIVNGDYVSIQDLNSEELESFLKAVDVEVSLADLPTEEDKEVYKQGLIDLFDSESNVYNDLESTTEQIIKEIDGNHTGIFDKVDGEEALAANYRIKISTKIFAAGVNLTVSLICGGVGSGAVRAVIKKFGTQRAIELINRQIVGKLTVWGIKQIVGVNLITQLVTTTIKNVLDPGAYVAKQIDARDRMGTSGYIEF